VRIWVRSFKCHAHDGLFHVPGGLRFLCLRWHAFRRAGLSGGRPESQHGVTASQEKLVAGSASEKLDLTVGLAVIGFEGKWQVPVQS
jgi:hypothetical protein